MKIDLEVIPHESISNMPDEGGYFPFAIDGPKKYIVECSLISEANPEKLITKWMQQINQFPIFAMAEIYNDQRKELEQDCESLQVHYETIPPEKKNDCFYKVKIENHDQFSALFPYFYGNGSSNNLVLWSLKHDVFSNGKRKFANSRFDREKQTVIVNMKTTSCVFWISYDGSSIVAISNEDLFSLMNNE